MTLNTLETEGCVQVRYPEALRIGVEEGMKAWVEFCALHQDDKTRFGYDPDAKVSGNGYELKLDLAAGDLKEDAHLRVIVRDDLMARALRVDPVIAPRFVEKALAINELMVPVITDFARSMEARYSEELKGFEGDIMAYQPQWLIRFLHYFGDRKPGDEIGAPHVDKGGFTLHLYESHPGVERLDFETREWKPLPLSHEDTLILPGMGLQHRSRCRVKALCHRIIATEDTAKVGRFSAVCFFNFRNVRFYDKATFGRLQNWAPGAFYDMPFEELDQYYID